MGESRDPPRRPQLTQRAGVIEVAVSQNDPPRWRSAGESQRRSPKCEQDSRRGSVDDRARQESDANERDRAPCTSTSIAVRAASHQLDRPGIDQRNDPGHPTGPDADGHREADRIGREGDDRGAGRSPEAAHQQRPPNIAELVREAAPDWCRNHPDQRRER